MGIFKLNGIDYMGGSGGGNTNYEELTQLEYDALTEEEKNNGTIYFITDTNSNQDDKFQPIIYTEKEREIGVFIDGKPLYQKSINVTSITSASFTVPFNVLNIDKLVDVKGMIYMTGGEGFEPFNDPATGISAWMTRLSDFGKTGAVVTIGSNRYNQGIDSIIIIIQYTKTTDQSGSGTWTPQGVPAHHYSTEEQIVGTWVDGNTVYEKTLYCNGLSSTNDWTELDSSVSYDTLISVNGVRYSNNQKFCFTNSLEDIPRFQTKNDGKLYYFTTSTFSGDFYITIQYTKQSPS